MVQVFELDLAQGGFSQQVDVSDEAVQGRSDLVGDVGQEIRFGLIGRFGTGDGGVELGLRLDAGIQIHQHQGKELQEFLFLVGIMLVMSDRIESNKTDADALAHHRDRDQTFDRLGFEDLPHGGFGIETAYIFN